MKKILSPILILLFILLLPSCTQTKQMNDPEDVKKERYSKDVAEQAIGQNSLVCIDGVEMWVNNQTRAITPHYVSNGSAPYIKTCNKSHGQTKVD